MTAKTPVRVRYKSSVEGDLRRLHATEAKRVISKFEDALAANPRLGIPLHREFRGLFKYRVGDYRIVFARTAESVLVLRVGNRKDVYR